MLSHSQHQFQQNKCSQPLLNFSVFISNEDTLLFPLNDSARSCHYFVAVCSWCSKHSWVCDGFAFLLGALLTSAFEIVATFEILWLFLMALLSFLVPKYQGFTELCYCFLVVQYIAAILCNRIFLNREPPNLLSAVPSIFFSLPQLQWNCYPHFCVS